MSTEHLPQHPSVLKGALFCALGYLALALMSACSKGIPSFVPITSILFFQNLICLICVLPQALSHIHELKTEKIFLHLVRDLGGVLSFFSLFFAIRYIPLVDAVLLQNTAPLWVPFVVISWAKKKVHPGVWWGSVIGFIGVLFIIKPGAEILNTGVLVGIASGIFLGITLVAIKRLSYTEPTFRILFYYFSIGTLLMLPFAIAHWQIYPVKVWLLLIGVGVFMYLGQISITYSFTHAKASTLAPISYTAVVWAGLIGWLVWDHIPDWISIVGMLLVIAGGIYTVVVENLSKPEA